MKSEGYLIHTVDVQTYGKDASARLSAQGISSLPAMVYYAPKGESDTRHYFGWKSKAEMRKMFDHTRDLEQTAE